MQFLQKNIVKNYPSSNIQCSAEIRTNDFSYMSLILIALPPVICSL